MVLNDYGVVLGTWMAIPHSKILGAISILLCSIDFSHSMQDIGSAHAYYPMGRNGLF